MASASWQQITRYVYFDPGDEVLEVIRSARTRRRGDERPMTVQRYRASGGDSVCVTVAGAPGVRFESQPDGFALGWPTALNAVDALRRALAVLPRPNADDRALIIFSSHREKEIFAHEVEDEVEGTSEPVALVQVDVGSASLAWSEPVGVREGPRTMSFGDDYYERLLARQLLTATTPEGVSQHIGSLLDEADAVMGPHLKPQN